MCNVCGQREAFLTACSATGAVSFAYCGECLLSGREPYGAVVASLIGMHSMGEVAEAYRPIVEATLKGEGKTTEELFADVVAFENEYCGRFGE